MLGHKVWQVCRDRFECWAAVRGEGIPPAERQTFPPDRTAAHVDAADFASVERVVTAVSPDVIVNGIGIVKQLKDASNPIPSIEINALFPHRLAKLAAERRARLIHVSTDCVFSGRTGGYTERDPADADDLYGRSKRLGEVAGPRALTLRTSIVGRELQGAHGLVEWFLGNRGGQVKGFTRAFFSGVTTTVLAGLIARVIEQHAALEGIYHVAADRISKYDLIGLVNDAYGAGVGIAPDDSLVIDRSLQGEAFQAATGWRAPSWPDMVAEMAADPTPYDQWRSA